MRGISKWFGAVQALTDVDFEVYAGEVVAIVGDNGAGKSTLVKILAGVHPQDAGTITFDGDQVDDPEPGRVARTRHRDGVPGPRALRQPRRGRQPVPRPGGRRHGTLDEEEMEQPGLEPAAAALGAHPVGAGRRSPPSPAASGRRSRSPARCVGEPSVVILDEPTAALGVAQTRRGAQPHRAAARARARRDPDQPQHGRRAGGRRPRDRAAPRPQQRRLPRCPTSATRRSSPPSPARPTTCVSRRAARRSDDSRAGAHDDGTALEDAATGQRPTGRPPDERPRREAIRDVIAGVRPPGARRRPRVPARGGRPGA